MPRPLVIAHRGASRHAAENSVPAVREAARLGADWVELDVRTTADGRPVLRHDDRVGEYALSALPFAEARRLAARLGGSLPTVREALSVCGGMGADMELKGPVADPGAVVAALAEEVRGFPGPLLLTSFWLPFLDELPGPLDAGVGVITAASYDPEGSVALDVAVGRGLAAALPEHGAVTAGLAGAARAAGVRLLTWTVDESARMRELASWGVGGIVTNQPGLARRVLERG